MQTGVLSPDQLALEFLSSGEFASRFGGMDDEAFVRLLYLQALGRDATEEELHFQAGVLEAGASRAQLTTNLLNSDEFRLIRAPRLTAFLLYAGILFRDPTPDEYAGTVAAVDAGADALDLIRGVLRSTEFAADLL
jgi:hypothetical protein